MIYLLGGVGIVIACLLAALGFEHERVVYETNRAVNAEQAVKIAEQRATALALLWSKQVDRTEAEVRKAQGEANAEITALNERIKKLPDRVIVFDTATASLFTDVTAAANAAAAPAVSDKQAAAVPDPAVAGATTAYDEREFADYIAKAGAAYRDIQTKLNACISFYNSLRNTP